MKNKTAIKSKYWGWSIYWVFSDGLEDCFVVARNIRSAIKVERDINGFDLDEVGACHVCKISEGVAKHHFSKRSGASPRPWPWYAYEPLLRKVGAQFREVGGREEVLVDGVVYCQGAIPREIGRRFVRKYQRSDVFNLFGEEARYTRSQEILYLLMGVCMARCQEIEHFITNSFVFFVDSREQRKYVTISEMVEGWKRKTFGQLIKSIEESYEFEAEFKDALGQFLAWRNRLVHGLVMQEQFDIDTGWGQDEIIVFLTRFELVSRSVKIAFRSAFYFSLEFGNETLLSEDEKRAKLSKAHRREASLFPHFFKLRT